MKPSAAPTGRRIVSELVREMQDRLYPLFYRTLTASVYHVYLQPDDYRDVEGIVPLIVLDAQKALNARVAQLNRRARWSAMLTDRRTIEAPSSGWEIHIHAEANGELKRGEIGIVSRLSMPAAPQFEGGTPTTRIVRTLVGAATRQSITSEEPAPPPVPPPPVPQTLPPLPTIVPTTPPASRTQTATEKPPVPVSPAEDGLQGFARLAYVDEQGPHVYAMTKDVVSIGRGGREHWVDVQLVTTPRVSREHCRIRRDDRGRFFLHDLSTWGTSIDGKPVRPASGADDMAPSAAHELELPSNARIQIADAVVIEFQAQSDGVVA